MYLDQAKHHLPQDASYRPWTLLALLLKLQGEVSSFCFKCFTEIGNSYGTDAQTDILQRRIYYSQKSHIGIEITKNYHLQNLLPTDFDGGCYHLGVPLHPEVIGAHEALASLPISYLMATS